MQQRQSVMTLIIDEFFDDMRPLAAEPNMRKFGMPVQASRAWPTMTPGDGALGCRLVQAQEHVGHLRS